MNEIVTQLNSLVTTLNGINPYWYIALVGPLTTIVMHLLKAEQEFEKTAFVKRHALALHILLSALAGAFYAVFQTDSVHTFLIGTGLIGAPIYAIGNVLYQTVASKIEAYRVTTKVSSISAVPAAAEPDQTVAV